MIFYEVIKSDKKSENNSVIVTELFSLVTCLNGIKETVFPSNLCPSKSCIFREPIVSCILRAQTSATGYAFKIHDACIII